MTERCFEQDRIMMLNAIYDLLETMDLPIMHINSEAGSIVFGTKKGEPFHMTVFTVFPDKKTQIRIGKMEDSKPMNREEIELTEVLFDEMESMFRRARKR